MDLNLLVGGEAGQGVQTVSGALSTILQRSGYFVFSIEDYQSRIRGGHSFTQVRFSTNPLRAALKEVDILACLNEETYQLHRRRVKEGGWVLGAVGNEREAHFQHFLPLNFEKIAEGVGNKIFANIVAVGAILGILGLDLESADSYLEEIFARKGEEIVEKNKQALRRGRDEVIPYVSSPLIEETRRGNSSLLVLDGNQALGWGALLSGCQFYSAYPMTPSTGILNFISSHAKEYGVVVEQAEDEIAAINMAIGASYAGARAMTATSGGGFCLMAEGLGLAAMTETPLVVVDAQRPGPSTGLPTRTSQGDLEFVIHASHDEFPRFVFAPRDPQEAINLVIRAFNLAEKYQVPVIILSDQYLADSKWTYENLEVKERPDAPQFSSFPLPYRRYLISPSGVSPRAIPGLGKALVVADSDEHDEFGHLTEDLNLRVEMHKKRMRKKETMRKEVRLPYHREGKDLTLIGWGSTWGVIEEAGERLKAEGIDSGIIHFSEIYPLPLQIEELFSHVSLPVVVENNYGGQLANLLERELKLPFPFRINSYNGRPFLVEELLLKVKEVGKNG
ncbi:MAG: 2-oxoacid:acceptor oxidoreductase subunit alpha [Atribacterota bacterium]|nr:2-oxoacid:acceptor oxidoreductase subunit alpha [Atribacterota bacterium]HOA98377.1 2-oxoacid:acceptor oxidoreductase subunit alpha [Candidatus Atribacteria bacterium]HQD33314.1 2-oxoacid:acceptor oxidoreductase subunit alpha [Candidatus Atribacteria bacterium]